MQEPQQVTENDENNPAMKLFMACGHNYHCVVENEHKPCFKKGSPLGLS